MKKTDGRHNWRSPVRPLTPASGGQSGFNPNKGVVLLHLFRVGWTVTKILIILKALKIQVEYEQIKTLPQ